MTPEQLQQLRDALANGRIKEEYNGAEWRFPHGWNAGVEFAENQINKILKEGAEDDRQEDLRGNREHPDVAGVDEATHSSAH